MRLAWFAFGVWALLAVSSARAQWIDAKTGKTVPSGPILATKSGYPDQSGPRPGIEPGQREGIAHPDDPDRAYDPVSGRNFFFDRATCEWKDTRTGKTVPSGPILATKSGYPDQSGARPGIEPGQREGISHPDDPNRAYDPVSGRNFVRLPCRPQKSKTGEQPKTGNEVGSVPPVKLEPSDQRILTIHNAERAAVGAPPLRWNPALEASATAYAQQLARTGQRVHAPREGRGDVRENLNQGMAGWNTDQMLRNWLDEKTYFVPGLYPNVSTTGDWKSVSHYTQMIWPTTTDVGCGMASGSGYQWLVCRYSPGGNKDGKPVGRPPAVATVTSYRWIDVKTGKPVTDRPVVTTNGKTYYVQADIGDPNRAYDPESGRNFARENGQWIDVKTGKPVTSRPVITSNGKTYYLQANIGDPNSAYDPETGRNFAREPVGQQPASRP